MTAREREILLLLAEGLAGNDVAEKLSISRKTVATHIQHVLAKLQVSNRAQAVSMALRAQPAIATQSRPGAGRTARPH